MNLGTSERVIEPLLTGLVKPVEDGNLVLATVTSIRAGSHHILVDTGGLNQQLALQQRLASLPPVTAVILTHFHWDHCANLRLFPGTPVYAMTEPYWFDRATRGDIQLNPLLMPTHEGDVVEDLAHIWAVPGHTANHIAVSVPVDSGQVWITGDAISDAQDAARGQPHFAFYSLEEARRQVARILDSASWIIPGHGAPFQVVR